MDIVVNNHAMLGELTTMDGRVFIVCKDQWHDTKVCYIPVNDDMLDIVQQASESPTSISMELGKC